MLTEKQYGLAIAVIRDSVLTMRSFTGKATSYPLESDTDADEKQSPFQKRHVWLASAPIFI